MKKLLFVLAIGAFAACNDNAEKTSTSTTDTTSVVTPANPDTAAVAPMDTTASKMDTTTVITKKDTTVKTK